MKHVIISFFVMCLYNNAKTQVNVDSLEREILNIKFSFMIVGVSDSGKSSPGSFVHCYLTCDQRKRFENASVSNWMYLLEKNSKIGLIVTALLYDLHKQSSMVFQHREFPNKEKWKKKYWYLEISFWSKFLRENIYRYSESDCWGEFSPPQLSGTISSQSLAKPNIKKNG